LGSPSAPVAADGLEVFFTAFAPSVVLAGAFVAVAGAFEAVDAGLGAIDGRTGGYGCDKGWEEGSWARGYLIYDDT